MPWHTAHKARCLFLDRALLTLGGAVEVFIWW